MEKMTTWCFRKISIPMIIFLYAAGENSVVGLIQTTIYSEYTMEDYMPDQDVVDTMENDMMDSV